MKKYYCYFEDESKNIYFELTPYDPNGTVKLSVTAYQGKDNIIEVALTREQIMELSDELNQFKSRM